MVTYYVDYEGGNDASAGTSFATRWQTLVNGATTARIAPGDEIRVMASPDPTSIGNATWTGGGRPLSATITSSTNATPIVVTTTASHGLVTGDYVMITGHTVNTNANGVWRVGTTPTGTTFQILQIDGTNTTGNGVGGATGNFTNVNNVMVKTASPLVQNIALCGGLGQKPVWTASTNVTTTVETSSFKEGNSCASITMSAAFTTGKAAYYTLPATLDLSGYQQVSFWVRTFGPVYGAAGAVYLALCTDTIGDTVAHVCNVPSVVANPWFPVTVNLGTNLNSAIRSVAFYVVTDNGAQQFLLDNIIACKAASSADSVTITSLISKSDGTGDEAWYGIQSINSDAIMLGNVVNGNANGTDVRGYDGVTETVTTYKRETVKTTPQSGTDSNGVVVINDSGTAGNVIAYSGGWNRTDMSTQTGVTWLDGQNGQGRGLSTITPRSFVTADRINLCRYGAGLILGNSSDISIGNIYTTACTTFGVNHQNGMRAVTITNCWANNNAEGVIMTGIGLVITNAKLVSNNSSNGISFNSARYNTVGSLVAGNNSNSTASANIRFTSCFDCTVGTATLTNSKASAGIFTTSAFRNFINGGSSSGNAQGVNISSTTSPSELYLNNFTINEATEVSTGLGGGFLYSNRHDNTDNNSWVWQSGIGTINQQTSVVDSPATTAWQMRPTATTTAATTPLMLKLGTVVCAASSLVTVTARMRRDDTGLTMQLVCPGGQISGVTNDVSTNMTAAANTWETVTITFTPTKAGAVDIYAYAFGGSTFSGYVSNLTASQA